jgi:hypothetical protein
MRAGERMAQSGSSPKEVAEAAGRGIDAVAPYFENKKAQLATLTGARWSEQHDGQNSHQWRRIAARGYSLSTAVREH